VRDLDQYEDQDQDQEYIYSVVHGYRVPVPAVEQSQEMYKRILARQGQISSEEAAGSTISQPKLKSTVFDREIVYSSDEIGYYFSIYRFA
jgi:hypothetical protein